MDEERLFRELGEIKANVSNIQTGQDQITSNLSHLRQRIDNAYETRVSVGTFRWIIGALFTGVLTVFGVIFKLHSS